MIHKSDFISILDCANFMEYKRRKKEQKRALKRR
ncbi:unnamed protein product [Arabidopsis thaliana]|uniref:Uncharacterized protein n=2 Tax=Arabidopsis thaliana TaxID=3702 RepID=A0A654FQD4_ARATH|nr:uncharacterized protein AT4G17243 [Arabidopsis thaliana]ANM67831.1 hypothetical protein AT4G17243 [Arabidopsis thaliana]CAA0395574.1 unnamed protein product [Arabidopsis thaliana]VYS63006.1 unnamed protein product [Arabidopsis thaliana]|eukprot:NP_001329632.1 hypothetical protein AT4G17243 [Arabidopsis thaliana]